MLVFDSLGQETSFCGKRPRWHSTFSPGRSLQTRRSGSESGMAACSQHICVGVEVVGLRDKRKYVVILPDLRCVMRK